MAYYFDHQAEIDQEIAAELEQAEQVQSNGHESPVLNRGWTGATSLDGRAPFTWTYTSRGPSSLTSRAGGVDALTAPSRKWLSPCFRTISSWTCRALGRVLFTQDIRFRSTGRGLAVARVAHSQASCSAINLELTNPGASVEVPGLALREGHQRDSPAEK